MLRQKSVTYYLSTISCDNLKFLYVLFRMNNSRNYNIRNRSNQHGVIVIEGTTGETAIANK